MNQVLAFTAPGQLGADPADLREVPREWLERVPMVRQYEKPRKRTVHTLCRPCEPSRDEWNGLSDTLDRLWDNRIRLQRGRDIRHRIIVERQNEINRLRYEQLFNPS